MLTPFVHLHVHSCYSLLEGLATPAQLASAAVAAGQSALALTDTHGIIGAIEFYTACRAAGVRPILGLELAVAPPASLVPGVGQVVLLACDMMGWSNLCRLSTLAQTRPDRDPARGVTFDQMVGHAAGLICFTGGHGGLAHRYIAAGQPEAAEQWLRHLRDAFADRLYVELAPAWPTRDLTARDFNAALFTLARQRGLPVVATNNVHTLTMEQAALQRTLTAMRLQMPLGKLPAEAAAPPGTCFTDARGMLRDFAEWPEAVGRTVEVADRCQVDLPLDVPRYPAVPLPSGETAESTLRERATSGAVRLYGEVTPALRARLDHELTVIGARGYAPLFLIMEEIMDFARHTGVPTSSRGSAASSLVAHCLAITSPDPMRLNLYFERFLNPARASPPDIDTDLCSVRRDSVIRHVYEQYGADRVAMVSTIMRFRERSALREVAKAHGFSLDHVKELADYMPHRWWGPPNATSTSGAKPNFDPLLNGPFGELAQRYGDAAHRLVFEQSSTLLGLPRHLSVHPGGVVIAPSPLTDLVPCHLAGKGIVITQFDLASIARLGLVKIDLLGIRGLTVLGDLAPRVAQAADAKMGTAPGDPLAALESIPEDDEPTRATVRHGRTIGCFQIESPGMRATLREVGAQSIDDLMVALALYRPGPLTGGLKDSFVRRHNHVEAVQHIHPALATLLGDTYGVILYQEQVLRIAHDLAGLTLADADLLRRAMSHFDPGQQMVTLKRRFVAGAAERNGVPAETAERVWELMAAFAGYGFPKAHAASYALVAWRAAWCKTHFPAEFMAAVLANWGGYYPQSVYLTEARRMGLALRPPHVNHSDREFSVSAVDGEPRLYMGLNQVRDLTTRTAQRLLRERPFSSLADLLSRADPRPVEAENLVRVGALSGLGTVASLLRELKVTARRPGQLALFGLADAPEPDWSLAEQVAAQEELLGAGVTAHRLELVKDKIDAAGALTTVGAAARLGEKVRVAGSRQTWHRTATARGDVIYFMSLEDLEGMLDVIIFGDVYRKHKSIFATGGPFVIEGTVELDPSRGEPTIRAERLWPLIV